MNEPILFAHHVDAADAGGVAALNFDLLTPAAVIEATELELAGELDDLLSEGSVASIALRRWQARSSDDVALIERLADADFFVSYHLEPGGSASDGLAGTVSLAASMWFGGLEEADTALVELGAEARWATYTPLVPTPAEECVRFLVGFGPLSAS